MKKFIIPAITTTVIGTVASVIAVIRRKAANQH